ncbi:MAG: AraC family transcriptional regulator [Myxococcota bacterium]
MRSSRDVLSFALEALKVSGSVVLHHAYAKPWAIHIPRAEELATALNVDAGTQVVAFHVAERGEFELSLLQQPVGVNPGELAVAFGGEAHRLHRGTRTRAVSLADILTGTDAPPDGEGVAGATKLLSGVFMLRDTKLNPLLSSLPALVHTRLLDGPLEPIGRLLQRELGSGEEGSAFVVDRALEVLCAGVIREQLRGVPPEAVGLLQGLRDERLSRSLKAFHQNPSAPWDLALLARHANLSRSRYAARFSELFGEGPMTYVTRWRMHVAARHLRDGDATVETVAERVGYQSVPAFSRVFKRSLGVPPARYRRNHRP